METIKIPSPSAFLDPPPVNRIAKLSTPKKQQGHSSPTKATAADALNSSGGQRPKQSKSRNGCITCKTKRLKCDETKPSCQQCHKRNVTCGGYKKDFKWRPFEETSAVSKSVPKKKASPPPNGSFKDRATSPPRKAARKSSTPSATIKSPCTGDDLVSPISSTVLDDLSSSGDSVFANAAILGGQSHPLNFSESLTLDLNRFENPGPPESELSNFMLSDSDLELMSRSLPFELGQSGSTLPAGQQSFSSMLEDETDDVEDIIRDSDPGLQLWPVQDSPTLSAHRNGLSDPMLAMLLQEPNPIPGSEEMLIVRFDRQTCGILSVKDGAHENPWRTWIWPMAKESPALYHAVFAMAAFHSSKDNPALRVHGMEHMRKSIACLVQGMEQMQTDAALATTLSLAFAESWDQHTSTGIQHLKGAKALMRQTVNSRMRRDMPGNELTRLRFLYNTWLYMDVIARLTSSDEGDNDELITVPFVMPSHSSHQVDPLMGCATTLFPLIGRAANLIQRVRKSESNSFATISEALELKTLIKTWDLPTYFDPPEDPTSELSDSIQTAYAYRSATLLYLHQAVPEIPSESAATLAEETLKYLATVPLSSRTNIVHIFPLLAASCEFEKEKERTWILDRWESMQNRLKIGNIDRCVDVVREVWRRRDSFQAENQRHRRRATSQTDLLSKPVDITASTSARRKSTISAIGRIESEKTVRGRLHWVGVMKDWKWEVLLG